MIRKKRKKRKEGKKKKWQMEMFPNDAEIRMMP